MAVQAETPFHDLALLVVEFADPVIDDVVDVIPLRAAWTVRQTASLGAGRPVSIPAWSSAPVALSVTRSCRPIRRSTSATSRSR